MPHRLNLKKASRSGPDWDVVTERWGSWARWIHDEKPSKDWLHQNKASCRHACRHDLYGWMYGNPESFDYAWEEVVVWEVSAVDYARIDNLVQFDLPIPDLDISAMRGGYLAYYWESVLAADGPVESRINDFFAFNFKTWCEVYNELFDTFHVSNEPLVPQGTDIPALSWEGVRRRGGVEGVRRLREACGVGNEAAARSLCRWSPFWIVDPQAVLTANMPIESVVEALLTRYPVPGALLRDVASLLVGGELECWESFNWPRAVFGDYQVLNEDSPEFLMVLLICLGQGGSLRRLFGQAPTKALPHLSAISGSIPFRQSVFAGHLVSRGADASWAATVALHQGIYRNPFYFDYFRGAKGAIVADMTAPVYQEMINCLVQWSSRAAASSPTDQSMVLDYMAHIHSEMVHGSTDLRFPGSWASAVRRSREYQNHLQGIEELCRFGKGARLKRRYYWAAHNLQWDANINRVHWSVYELTSTSELIQEGQKLHHCVGTYAARCFSGESIICSLRKSGQSHLTIELSPSLKIRQVKGHGNCDPTEEERAVVTNWLCDIRSRSNFSSTKSVA